MISVNLGLGYIVPQEFNLLADKAQNEIFESYFHDLKTAYHKGKAQVGVGGDEIEMIQAKLHSFKTNTTFIQLPNNPTANLPEQLYFIDVLFQNNNEVVELTKKEIAYTENNPLLQATTNRMVYVREQNDGTNHTITIYPTPTTQTTFDIHYYFRPTSPNWTYVVVSGNALYDASSAGLKNFELHPSEEEALVMRILELSGVSMRSQDLAQAATYDQQNTLKKEND